jgi:hypothetical protein
LGLTGFYRKFIKNYAQICLPLTNLSKDVPYKWGSEQESAFNQLKSALTTAPILIFPDFSKVFILETDSSGLALGAVLSQNDNSGQQHVVAFLSHKLTDAERKWDIRELETFAIVWSCSQLRYYLLGKHFKIFTDCKNVSGVKWILHYDFSSQFTQNQVNLTKSLTPSHDCLRW